MNPSITNTFFLLLTLLILSAPTSARAVSPKNDAPVADAGQAQATMTAREQIEARQAERAAEIPAQDNAFNYMLLYMRPPEFRDQAYAALARELGINADIDQLPYYRNWHSYMYEALEETRELREQYELLLNGKARPAQVPQVKQWLDAVGPALDALRQTASLPHLWQPVETDLTLLRQERDAHYVYIEISDLMESFRARSMFALATDDLESAVRDCLAIDQIAKLLLQVESNAVLEDAARDARDNNDALVRLLQSGRLSADQLRRLADQWAIEPKGPSSAEVMDHWERLWLIDYFERIKSGDEQTPSFLLEQVFAWGAPVTDQERAGWDWMVRDPLFDTDHAIKHINARYDWLVTALTKPQSFAEAAESLKEAHGVLRTRGDAIEMMVQAYEKMQVPAGTQSAAYTENIVDGMLAMLMHPNRVLDGPFDNYDYQTQRALSNTMIALARYRLTEGAYPDKLADLVPAYLAALPSDPYQPAHPIRFKAEPLGAGITLTLYSVGQNQADDQGEDDDPSLILMTGL